MTKTKEALEALDKLEKYYLDDGEPKRRSDTIRAALINNPYVVLGVLFDKHEELKAIAESMYRALQLTKSDAEKNGFKYGRQSNCVKALTEYNKYKGG